MLSVTSSRLRSAAPSLGGHLSRARAAARPRAHAHARPQQTRGCAGDSGSAKPHTLLDKYLFLLDTHPIATKSITSGVIAAGGDVSCQMLGDDPFSLSRLGTFTLLGGALVGPTLHFWYSWLGRSVTGAQASLKRLALDQGVFAPLFLPTFFTALLTLEGRPGAVPGVLRAEWWPSCVANWGIWIPAQFINFRFVPGRFQVLFANCVGLLWNVYLSLVSHR